MKCRHWLWAPLLLPRVVAAQETTGEISGRVRASATAIAGAQILAVGAHIQRARHALTASDGVFRLLALPPGVYTIRVTRLGYHPTVIDSVRVQLGRATGLGEIALRSVEVQSLNEVHIVAPALTLDPARTTVGATLEQADYQRAPALARDYKSLMVTLPHVNTSYYGDGVSAAGSAGAENMFFIDGVNVTSPVAAATSLSLPYNFVRSVQVRTGGYEAQYGRALGAVVNAVTYSGTNEFEASTFGFFTNDALTARPRVLPSVRSFDAVGYDVGVRVGGPVVRDRLWFAAAYNPRVEREQRDVSGLGVFPDRLRADVFAGKLTWQMTPAATIEANVMGDPTTHHRVAPFDPVVGALTPLNAETYRKLDEHRALVQSLRATVSPGAPWLLEATLTRTMVTTKSIGDGERALKDPVVIDFIDGTLAGGLGTYNTTDEARTAGTMRATLNIGRHTALAGIEYEDTRSDGVFSNPGNGFILREDSALYYLITQDISGTVHNRTPAAYLQESWRATDRLAVNAGVRWSSQILVGASGRTAQRFDDEWQPRLGFSWQLDAAGTRRVLGSYGRFYQQEPLALGATDYVGYASIFKSYSGDPRKPGTTLVSTADGSFGECQFGCRIDGLEVDNLDEFTLGYEQVFRGGVRFTARAIRRDLRSAYIEAGDSTGNATLGTPGKGGLANLPSAKRRYAALEVTMNGGWNRLPIRASYVLSRLRGNYTGVNSVLNFWDPFRSTSGPLPNDRTHVLKVVGSYQATRSLAVGSFLTWQTGTPLNEFAGLHLLSPRGSAGRTPSNWDANFRFSYDARPLYGAAPKVILDVLHLGNPQRAVLLDERHYANTDEQGQPTAPNPNWGRPLAFQPSMMVRFGVEVGR